MRVIEFFKDKNVQTWFILTIVPSFLPVMATSVWTVMWQSDSAEFNDYVKMTDLVFTGISVNISSLGLWQSRLRRDQKRNVMVISAVLLVELSLCLAAAYAKDVMSGSGLVIVTGMVLASIAVNLRFNAKLWKIKTL